MQVKNKNIFCPFKCPTWWCALSQYLFINKIFHIQSCVKKYYKYIYILTTIHVISNDILHHTSQFRGSASSVIKKPQIHILQPYKEKGIHQCHSYMEGREGGREHVMGGHHYRVSLVDGCLLNRPTISNLLISLFTVF